MTQFLAKLEEMNLPEREEFARLFNSSEGKGAGGHPESEGEEVTLREKAIAKDSFGTKISIISYVDDGIEYHDLSTNGQRILLTPTLADHLAVRLMAWAQKARGK